MERCRRKGETKGSEHEKGEMEMGIGIEIDAP